MKAAVVNSLGKAPQYQEFPDPVPAENEVPIKVRAAGLHPVVKARASGAHYSSSGEVPAIPGIDGVGTLEDGTRVYFGFSRPPYGTMAECAAAQKQFTIPLPAGIDDLQAAAIVNPGMSAWGSIHDRGGLAAGETILILGATGVAGRLAIQVARHLGARRIIAAGRNVDALAGESVDRVVALGDSEDAIRDAFTAEAAAGIDVVIDYLWGRPAELVLDALAKGFKASATRSTRYVEVGESAGKTVALRGDVLRSIDLTLKGSGFGSVSLDRILAFIPMLFSLAAEGKLKVDVEAAPLSEVESAWTRSEKGRRIVFTI